MLESGQQQMPLAPLAHAISACERGWTHPDVVAILEGNCTDYSQVRPETCPISTEGWTRRVHFVREAGWGEGRATRR